MTEMLARINPTPAPTLVLQEYGAFTVTVQDENTLIVHCPKGVLVDGILYPFSGQMVKHEAGWRFWAQSIATPKMAPKARAAALEVLTAKVNEYVKQHPDLFAALAIKRWEQKLDSLRYEIRQAQSRMVRRQADIETLQRDQANQQERLENQRREREEHLANRPEGAKVPEDE